MRQGPGTQQEYHKQRANDGGRGLRNNDGPAIALALGLLVSEDASHLLYISFAENNMTRIVDCRNNTFYMSHLQACDRAVIM